MDDDRSRKSLMELFAWAKEHVGQLTDEDASTLIDFLDRIVDRNEFLSFASDASPSSEEHCLVKLIISRLSDLPHVNQSEYMGLCKALRDYIETRYARKVRFLLKGLKLGEVVGKKYCVLSKLGEGGTSLVYSAISNEQQLVALKLVPGNAPGNESRNSLLASHRNVRRVLDDLEHEGGRVLVLEYAPFMLDWCLSKDSQHELTLEQKYTISRHLCAGLSWADDFLVGWAIW